MLGGVVAQWADPVQSAANGSIREKGADGEIAAGDLTDSAIDIGLSVFGW